MKRKQRPNVSLLLWLTKEFIILSILSNLVCTALYMAVSWLLTGTPLPASHSSGLGPLLFLIGSTVILGCGLNYRFNQFLTGLAGGLRGVAEGNFSLRLDPRRAGWEKKRIAFSADLEPVSYVGNEELMRHVWINLLNNAIKFTPEGGEVSVTLQCSPEQIQVRISDTGIGMSPEMMSHIFDQYYQGEPNHTEKGLGLGLSIVHRIVELCGGQIQVDSIPDQGSVFTVLLPRSR